MTCVTWQGVARLRQARGQPRDVEEPEGLADQAVIARHHVGNQGLHARVGAVHHLLVVRAVEEGLVRAHLHAAHQQRGARLEVRVAAGQRLSSPTGYRVSESVNRSILSDSLRLDDNLQNRPLANHSESKRPLGPPSGRKIAHAEEELPVHLVPVAPGGATCPVRPQRPSAHWTRTRLPRPCRHDSSG